MNIKFKKSQILKKINTVISYRKKPGILYVKNISAGIQFKEVKNIFEKFGNLGRIFFIKRHEHTSKFKIQKIHRVAGWIEYLNKKDAKQAMAYLKKYSLSSYLSTNISVEYLRNFSWEELTGFFS